LDVIQHQEQTQRDLFAFLHHPVGVQARAAFREIARRRREHRPRGAALGGHAQIAALVLTAGSGAWRGHRVYPSIYLARGPAATPRTDRREWAAPPRRRERRPPVRA